MGFFDLIEEAANAPETQSPVVKMDTQDSSFLIIDDSAIVATTLPDTAAQLFNPIIEPVSPLSEISFFSEPNARITDILEETIATKDVSSSEVSFFDEPVIESTNPEPVATKAESENMISFMEVPKITATPVENIIPLESNEKTTIIDNVMNEEIIEPVIVDSIPDKNDIYAPMKRAIAEYQVFLATLMKDAEAKDQEIIDFNAQISEAKKVAKLAIDKAQSGAKESLEKRKILDAEMKRISEMSELLSGQIK